MADALTSALVKQLVSRALGKIEEEVGMVKNVKTDVKKLKKRLATSKICSQMLRVESLTLTG